VKEDAENKLQKFLHPVSGGFDGKGWPFGRSIYISEIYEVIDCVEGVNYIVPDSVKIDCVEGVDSVTPKSVNLKKRC